MIFYKIKILYLLFIILIINQWVCLNLNASELQQCLFNLRSTLSSHRSISLDSRDSFLIETEKSLQQSNDIRFFLGNQEMPIPMGELQPGHTYTTIIHNNKLVIGRNIPGDIDGLIGGQGSHDTLITYLKKVDQEKYQHDPYDYKAGALGIKEDGTIVISGYHNKGPSKKSYQAIEYSLKEIFPQAKVEVTEDQLLHIKPPIKHTTHPSSNFQIKPTILDEVEKYFQQSDRVIFFNGSQNQATFQQAFPTGEFKLGNTYTALIIENKLILGKNISGKKDPNIIGGPGSHDRLYKFLEISKTESSPQWIGQSGAIGIGTDGTINISGYHRGKKNLDAAKKIRSLILEFCPYCQTKITPDRLETL